MKSGESNFTALIFSHMHWVYILYSETAQHYYIGETSDIVQRLQWHNEHVFKKSSTAIASDWRLVWKLDCKSIRQARKIEAFIKKMKSVSFIKRLTESNGVWLLEKFS